MDADPDLRNVALMVSHGETEKTKRTKQEAAREYVRIVLDTLDMKSTHLAELIDVHASTINRLMGDKPIEHSLSVNNLLKIREKTGVKFTDFVVRAYNLPTSFLPGDAPLTEPLSNRRAHRAATLPAPAAGPDDTADLKSNVRFAPTPARALHGREHQVPVMGSAQGGADGSFELNTGEPIGFVDRPPRLANRQGIYTIFLEGDSMVPIHEPGELLFIDSARKPWVGRDALIELNPTTENDAPRAFLKRVTALNSDFVELKEWTPEERTFRVPRASIKSMHLVLRNSEMY